MKYQVIVVMALGRNKLIKYSPFPMSSLLVLKHYFVFLYESNYILLHSRIGYHLH